MILVDANLLIYAVDRESVHHSKARIWVEQILSETRPVGIAWIVVLAFLRVTTIQRQTRNVLSPERAIAFVDCLECLTCRSFSPVNSTGRFCETFFR